MASKFKLYDSTGINLLYTFIAVQETNAPQSPRDIVEHSTVRGKGSIIIDGGDSAWDLIIRGKLYTDSGYEALSTLITTLESTIALNTRYVLKIEVNGTTLDYNVKRITPIEYPQSFRTAIQDYTCTLRVNCW